MKRSEINRALQEMEATLKRCQINLPPFCHFTPGEWREKGHEYDEIRDNMLGWMASRMRSCLRKISTKISRR